MTCSFRRVRYLEIFLAHAWEKEEKDNNFSFVGKIVGSMYKINCMQKRVNLATQNAQNSLIKIHTSSTRPYFRASTWA